MIKKTLANLSSHDLILNSEITELIEYNNNLQGECYFPCLS